MNFSAYPEISYILCIQFLVKIRKFWTFNVSATPDIPYIYNVHNFPLNICNWGYSIFLLIQTFHAYNVHNFQFNFRSSGYSIFLQIQTFRTYIMYAISRWIFALLDIQIFYKSRHSLHLCTKYTVEFTQFQILKFSATLDILYI